MEKNEKLDRALFAMKHSSLDKDSEKETAFTTVLNACTTADEVRRIARYGPTKKSKNEAMTKLASL